MSQDLDEVFAQALDALRVKLASKHEAMMELRAEIRTLREQVLGLERVCKQQGAVAGAKDEATKNALLHGPVMRAIADANGPVSSEKLAEATGKRRASLNHTLSRMTMFGLLKRVAQGYYVVADGVVVPPAPKLDGKPTAGPAQVAVPDEFSTPIERAVMLSAEIRRASRGTPFVFEQLAMKGDLVKHKRVLLDELAMLEKQGVIRTTAAGRYVKT